ncbi:hypothetical protein SDC9_131532 [bioreactor metagenome]|uniref:Uncharacterized protein n=1 Tax=bioreactor metagenome TaxID=1076179 RepID=A0A645D4P9_9ZZZZ
MRSRVARCKRYPRYYLRSFSSGICAAFASAAKQRMAGFVFDKAVFLFRRVASFRVDHVLRDACFSVVAAFRHAGVFYPGNSKRVAIRFIFSELSHNFYKFARRERDRMHTQKGTRFTPSRRRLYIARSFTIYCQHGVRSYTYGVRKA